MISMPAAYKQAMDAKYRNQSYMLVMIGIINQVAQKDVKVTAEHGVAYSYLSNFTRPFDNYDVELEYATWEQNWFKADGSMAFPPRSDETDYLYNNGIISKEIKGGICISFGRAYDIRGLTINWGRNYPVDFTVTNGEKTVSFQENDKAYWTTEEIFDNTEYLLIIPEKMVNGENRLRIQKILMGVGVSFENKKIQKSTKTEFSSPITEELTTLDFTLQIENYGRIWDVENHESAINYLEVGQKVTVRYGYEVTPGNITWMDGCVCNLSDWEADDVSMSFSAKDKLSDLSEKFYGGLFRSQGISLYDLAVEVLDDAGLDERQYDLDEYLKNIAVYNPLPCVTHKECLQIIANAGRCKLYTDRTGKICIKAAFATVISPERMKVQSDDAAPYSNLASVINNNVKYEYADMAQDHFRADGSMFFLPVNGNYLTAGFVSEQVSDENGEFLNGNPRFSIVLEAAMSYYSLKLNFFDKPAKEIVIRTYYEGVLEDTYSMSNGIEKENLIEHEFSQFDTIEFEFVKAQANSRIYVDSVVFGDVTDYTMDYRVMTKYPKGIQKEKVARIDVIRQIYGATDEIKSIFHESVDVTGYETYTFYFSEASYDVTVNADGQILNITANSSYFVTVDVSGLTGVHDFSVDGRAYAVTSKICSKVLNTTGTVEEWTNPLISEEALAVLQAEWLGNYYKNNIEYELSYRGEPRLDAGDLTFLENQYVPGLQIQIYEHKLTFNGALSGTVKARKVTSQEV